MLALFVAACDTEVGSPPRRPPARAATPTPEPARSPTPRPEFGPFAYGVPVEAIRSETGLDTAVLLQPGPGDPTQTLFGVSGIRTARLRGEVRFGSRYVCQQVAPGAAARRAAVVARELLRYSPALLRNAGIRWVVWCAGLYEGAQLRYAVPMTEVQTLLYDAEAFEADDFLVVTLHHELYHMLDGANHLIPRDEWLARNPSGARPGLGGAFARNASGALGSGSAGFVDEYAQSAVAEDQAEVFRFLATRPMELLALARRDPAIAAKRELLLGRIVRFCEADRDALICRDQ